MDSNSTLTNALVVGLTDLCIWDFRLSIDYLFPKACFSDFYRQVLSAVVCHYGQEMWPGLPILQPNLWANGGLFQPGVTYSGVKSGPVSPCGGEYLVKTRLVPKVKNKDWNPTTQFCASCGWVLSLALVLLWRAGSGAQGSHCQPGQRWSSPGKSGEDGRHPRNNSVIIPLKNELTKR